MKLPFTDQRFSRLIASFPLKQPGLTPREVKILKLVSRGKTNIQMGLILDISPRTVSKHLAHIYTKFGVESRTEAVVHFLQMNHERLQVLVTDLPDTAD